MNTASKSFDPSNSPISLYHINNYFFNYYCYTHVYAYIFTILCITESSYLCYMYFCLSKNKESFNDSQNNVSRAFTTHFYPCTFNQTPCLHIKNIKNSNETCKFIVYFMSCRFIDYHKINSQNGFRIVKAVLIPTTYMRKYNVPKPIQKINYQKALKLQLDNMEVNTESKT